MAEALTKEPEDFAREPMIVVKPKEPSGHLIDYPLINAQDPDLYCWLPTAAELDGLRPGMTVKIGLSSKLMNPEHFWVEIVERRGSRGFIGKVANDLQPGYGLVHGDHLVFCPHHVREISAS